jgi:DNA-binding transcriptional LysR family regulator
VVLDNNGALSDPAIPLTKVHTLRQIEIVKALAKHHHFGLAAKALRVSQPALTRSLKQLEAELGVTLFDRQGVTLTPFGEIVLQHGERAAAEFHELAREVALAKGLEVGELRIAAGPYPADISGERAIGLLSARHPNLAIELRIANWTRVAADVGDGSVDLGFAEVSEAQNDPNLDVLSSRSRPLSFFCGAEHPLAGKRPLTIEDLLDFSWVGPSVAGRLRKALPAVEKPFGTFDEFEDRFHPRILVETFSTAKRIVLAGLGIGAAVPFQIESELNEGRCVTLPVEAPWFSLNYGFIAKRGRTLSPAAKAFMEIVRTIDPDSAT